MDEDGDAEPVRIDQTDGDDDWIPHDERRRRAGDGLDDVPPAVKAQSAMTEAEKRAYLERLRSDRAAGGASDEPEPEEAASDETGGDAEAGNSDGRGTDD